jgi:NAD(P)-dependent dehydrogenase (short-subunit alcohol dehydrogenase family)
MSKMRKAEYLGTLIVTGASRGIGAAVAKLAGKHGYAVVVNFNTGEAEAKKVVDEIVAGSGRALAIQADVSREEQIVRMFETAERELGPIKALVNNAAITGGFARVEEVSSAVLANTFAVNVSGTILCSREAVRRMSTRRGGTGGAIVNISSRAVHTGSPGEWVHYAASKGAIDSFTIGLAREVATEGIRVNAVAPGLVDTGIHAANGDPGRLQRLMSSIPMNRAGLPHEVAEAVLWLLSPAASYATGAILPIGGGR